MEVLDLGSGTGHLARWLSTRVRIRPTLADVTEFDNRIPDFPFLRMEDPFRVPAPDRSFDAVLLLYVLHHIPGWTEQERLLGEAVRLSRGRVVVIEDTPTSAVDRAFNVGWDLLLNLRHGIPTPFTFRTVEGWRTVFARHGLSVAHQQTYRARWPTLLTYHHTLFVLDR